MKGEIEHRDEDHETNKIDLRATLKKLKDTVNKGGAPEFELRDLDEMQGFDHQGLSEFGVDN